METLSLKIKEKRRHLKITSLIIFVLFMATSCQENLYKEKNHRPESGYVANEKVAIAIATAIWNESYGKTIFNEIPFTATLKNGIWIVAGTLNESRGGVAYMEIRQRSGKILHMSHGKQTKPSSRDHAGL